MKKLVYKKNNAYEGIVTYENIKYTEEELIKLSEEIYFFEKKLRIKMKEYNSEYSYELGKFLSEKLENYKIVESERYGFWEMLRTYANRLDKRKTITELRDAYEYCYLLSKLPKELAIKYSRSKWDHLFDVVTARKDPRLYSWLEKNENTEFINSNDIFQNFCKALKIYLKKKDTDVLSDDELFEIYDTASKNAVLLCRYMKNNEKKISSKKRDEYFEKTRKINNEKEIYKIFDLL